jgi:hypothetical protein
MGTRAHIVRFEDLLKNAIEVESDAAEKFFYDLLSPMGMTELPADWRDRVRLGSSKELSATYRDNLSGKALELPDELPEIQKRLVDYAAPGLRQLLGYT